MRQTGGSFNACCVTGVLPAYRFSSDRTAPWSPTVPSACARCPASVLGEPGSSGSGAAPTTDALADRWRYVSVSFGFHAPAYLWLTVAPGRLNATGEALSAHPETTFAAAVTGSANLLVTVTCRTMDDLYSYVTTKVGALDAVHQVDVVPVLRRLSRR
jgi:hypothetical protein